MDRSTALLGLEKKQLITIPLYYNYRIQNSVSMETHLMLIYRFTAAKNFLKIIWSIT